MTRPEGLSAEEGETLSQAVVQKFVQESSVERHGIGVLDRSRCDRFVAPAVESIIAARLAAQREEIAQQIEAAITENDRADYMFWTGGMEDAARIARGGTDG